MAHIAERTVSHYQRLVLGYEVSTCPDPATSPAYCREVKPHIMFGVPRVWEKINAGVMAALAADPEKAEQFDEASRPPIPSSRRWPGAPPPTRTKATWAFLDDVAFGRPGAARPRRAQIAITGAAPIPAAAQWFRAIGVPLSEIYGMSENTGPMTWTPEPRSSPARSGRRSPAARSRSPTTAR
jgi:long-chain acyl-CoA synthetase